MALTSQQSIAQYGTPAYTGWPELEASNDARAKGLSGGGSGGSGYNFNFEQEVDKAFEELGGYYGKLLDEANGDLNKALARLQEDYDTGKRQKMASFNLSTEARNLAQESFSTDANQAYRTLATRQLARGINRKSAFAPNGGLGIADVEQQRLAKQIAGGQAQLDLQEKGQKLAFDQSGEIADIGLKRAQIDLPEDFNRYKTGIEEERKVKAGELALSREQRAYQRFEAGLI